MNFKIIVLFFTFIFVFVRSQMINGTVSGESGNPINNVLIFNIISGENTTTDNSGYFTIPAKSGNEIRFVKKGYERSAIILSGFDFLERKNIILYRTPEDIEEVQLPKHKLTGDLAVDAKNLTKIDKIDQLQKEIGVPKPPEKPRERPTEVTKDILLPLLTANLNIQGIYNVVSGKAKRQKRLYKYEDLQDNIRWIRLRVPDDYFTDIGISPEKIPELLQFALSNNPDYAKYIKAGNLSKVLLMLESSIDLYKSQK